MLILSVLRLRYGGNILRAGEESKLVSVAIEEEVKSIGEEKSLGDEESALEKESARGESEGDGVKDCEIERGGLIFVVVNGEAIGGGGVVVKRHEPELSLYKAVISLSVKLVL